MKNLVDTLTNQAVQDDVFSSGRELDEALLKEFYERNERKKEDEKWLKENKPAVKVAMDKLGKAKTDLGGYRVSVVVPDASHFDMDKVALYLESKGLMDSGYFRVKSEVDEEALANGIEAGEIDLEELKAYAWVEEKGAPRISVSKVKTDE